MYNTSGSKATTTFREGDENGQKFLNEKGVAADPDRQRRAGGFPLCGLNGYYRRVLLQNAEKQFEYEDQLCYDHIETYTATANSCLNTVILHLNSAMDASDLQNHIPRERTATQKKIYHALLNTFKMFRGPLEVAIIWDNGKFFIKARIILWATAKKN